MNKLQIIFVFSFLMTLLVGYFDYLTSDHISMMMLYAVPILLASWYYGKTGGIVVAATAAACWFVVNVTTKHNGTSEAVLSWDAFSRFGIFALLAYTVSLQVALKEALGREKVRASTDSLTGLLNKEAFRERVEEEINRARRYQHPLSLAFIDLNNFKQVNDTLGHAQGDNILQQVSEAINNTLRKTDIAGRIGGDEFTICLTETGPEHIRYVIEKMLCNLEIMTSQSVCQVTASIGVVTYVEISDAYDTMLGKADKLMYLTKGKRNNQANFLVIGNSGGS